MNHRMQSLLTTVVVVVAAAAALVWSTGKLPDVTQARLPGAAGGSDTYAVSAQFRDVLDLVPNSTVRVADVPVGRVSAIDVSRVDGVYVAVAQLSIDDSVELPAGTIATVRSTSLLGEKYIALTAPANGTGSLRDTGTIPLQRTSQDVEVEQLLASVGALLNGGGLQQLSTITREFASALGGREQDTRALLGDLEAIMAGLDRGRPALVAAIDSTARLSKALSAQREVISQAVTDLDPATGVLASQQRTLTTALRKLDKLSVKATALIRRSARTTIADLRALAPVAREVGKVAHLLPENLTLLVTYPFADTAVPAFSGAYGAFKGSLVIDLPALLSSLVPVTAAAAPTPPVQAPAQGGGSAATPPLVSTPSLPVVPGVIDVVGGLVDLLLPGVTQP